MVFSGHGQGPEQVGGPQVRQIAGILLKNMIQSYYTELYEKFGGEMEVIENLLFAMLMRIGQSVSQ